MLHIIIHFFASLLIAWFGDPDPTIEQRGITLAGKICIRGVSNDLGVGSLTDLEWVRVDEHDELLAIGINGAAFINPANLSVRTSVHYASSATVKASARRALDIDGDGLPEAVSTWSPYNGLNAFSCRTGELLWQILPSADSHFNPSVVLRSNQGPKFVVGTLANEVWIIDRNGEIVAKQSWEAPGKAAFPEGLFAAVDFDGDGTDELAYGQWGKVCVRDSLGVMLCEGKPATGASWIQMITPIGGADSKRHRLLVLATVSSTSIFQEDKTVCYALNLNHEAGAWTMKWEGPLSKGRSDALLHRTVCDRLDTNLAGVQQTLGLACTLRINLGGILVETSGADDTLQASAILKVKTASTSSYVVHCTETIDNFRYVYVGYGAIIYRLGVE